MNKLKQLLIPEIAARIKSDEVKKLMIAIVRKEQSTINSIKNDQNPQVVMVRKRAEARLELAEAVLKGLEGNLYDLKQFT